MVDAKFYWDDEPFAESLLETLWTKAPFELKCRQQPSNNDWYRFEPTGNTNSASITAASIRWQLVIVDSDKSNSPLVILMSSCFVKLRRSVTIIDERKNCFKSYQMKITVDDDGRLTELGVQIHLPSLNPR